MEGYGGWLIFVAIVGGYWSVQWLAKRYREKHAMPDVPSHSSEPYPNPVPTRESTLQDQLAATKASVRADFDQTQATLDAEARLRENQKHIDKVSADLKKAGADYDIDDFIENTKHFSSWAKGSHLDYLAEHGIGIAAPKEKGASKDDQTHGYAFTIEGREWTVRFSETGYSWVDTSSKSGTFKVLRGGEPTFEASMSLDMEQEWSRWHISLYGVRALVGLDWLHDLIRLNEVVKMKAEAEMRERNREEAATRAAALRPRG
jgi:hypothetical protein